MGFPILPIVGAISCRLSQMQDSEQSRRLLVGMRQLQSPLMASIKQAHYQPMPMRCMKHSAAMVKQF
jgi:hypothetical protein